MPTLKVSDGVSITLLGLGKIRPFARLSQKRITKSVRIALIKKYGEKLDWVSCSASFADSEWHGICRVGGSELTYTITMN